jgi:hypothetical protein
MFYTNASNIKVMSAVHRGSTGMSTAFKYSISYHTLFKRYTTNTNETQTEHEIINGPQEDPGWHRGTIWYENIFPFKIPIFDPRQYFINEYSKKYPLQKWQRLIPAKFPQGAEFKFVSAESNLKEGGLFLEFKYKGGTVNEALEAIQQNLIKNDTRSMFNGQRVNAYLVKGRPWVEDLLSRVPSNHLHVEFYGPDLTKVS